MTDKYRIPGISLPEVEVAGDLDGMELVLVLENGKLKLKEARTVAQTVLTTTASGNTVLVGADGTVYGLGTLGEFTLKRVAAFAVANNATNTYVSFDAVVENTTPFATLDLYDPTNPAMGDTAIFIPAGVTRIKFLANVGIPNTLSDGSTPLTAGSFRATIKQNQGTANLTPAVHVHYVPPATDTTGHLAVVSGWMDCVAGDYFELSIRHVFGGTVNFGGGLALYLQAEFK